MKVKSECKLATGEFAKDCNSRFVVCDGGIGIVLSSHFNGANFVFYMMKLRQKMATRRL